MSNQVAGNIDQIRLNIRKACERSGRSAQSIKIVAVSKKQTVEKMQQYSDYCKANNLHVIFGESYVQEFRDKRNSLSMQYESHLIGTLQSNKAKEAVRYFDLIESVHTEKLAAELNKEAAKLKKIQNIFIQINISNDPAKHGFSPESAEIFLRESISKMTSLKLSGLMTITQDYDLAEEARGDYKKMKILRDRLVAELPSCKNGLDLSMGMSHDYEVAIEEGADLVRIGTALFGSRDNTN